MIRMTKMVLEFWATASGNCAAAIMLSATYSKHSMEDPLLPPEAKGIYI